MKTARLAAVFGAALVAGLSGFVGTASALKVDVISEKVGDETYKFAKLTQCEPLEGEMSRVLYARRGTWKVS